MAPNPIIFYGGVPVLNSVNIGNNWEPHWSKYKIMARTFDGSRHPIRAYTSMGNFLVKNTDKMNQDQQLSFSHGQSSKHSQSNKI